MDGTDGSHRQFAAQPADQAQSTAQANALAESFVDTFRTELIADRVWRTNAQLELSTVDYIGWFNHRRLHSSIGNRPPVEHEHAYWARVALGYGPLLAQAAPTVTDLGDVVTVASPMSRSEQ